MPLAPTFAVHYAGKSTVVQAAAARYESWIRQRRGGATPAAAAGATLATLVVTVASPADNLTGWTANESYSLAVSPGGGATLDAPTPFGALRGLETFYQLLNNASTPTLPHSTIVVDDAPAFVHRSLMIDTGRRLYPLPFVRSIIDAMAMAKLNVLHLHLSDMGRFAWESKVFPELNVGRVQLRTWLPAASL